MVLPGSNAALDWMPYHLADCRTFVETSGRDGDGVRRRRDRLVGWSSRGSQPHSPSPGCIRTNGAGDRGAAPISTCPAHSRTLHCPTAESAFAWLGNRMRENDRTYIGFVSRCRLDFDRIQPPRAVVAG